MMVPAQLKIYHIVHVDRLSSIIADQHLWCDAEIVRRSPQGSDLTQLTEIDWQSVHAERWSGSGIAPAIKENKQAELLIEYSFLWHLVERIGVHSQLTYLQAGIVLRQSRSVINPTLSLGNDTIPA